MAAFRHAISHGIPIELDVQLARADLLVVVHDRDLLRLTGAGMAAADVDLDLLSRLRIGSSDERIALLPDMLAEVAGQVPVLLDVRRWGAAASAGLERAVAAAIGSYAGPLALQSFDPLAVLRFRRLISAHPIGQVSGRLESAGRLAALAGRSMAANLTA